MFDAFDSETVPIVVGGIDRWGVAMKRRNAHRVVDRVS